MRLLLDEIKLALGQRPVGRYVAIPPSSIPEPCRSLLVHNRDMTGTLSQFWNSAICIHPLRVDESRDSLYREVVLTAGEDRDARRVEAGAIRIHLGEFPSAAKTEILAGHAPFGGILTDHEIAFRSRPRAYFRTQTNEFLREAFPNDPEGTHYGRHNVLSTPEGATLAEVVEILPTSSSGG